MPATVTSDLDRRIRRHALAGMGLLQTAPFGRGAKGALNALERLGYVQIDTISVVNRAHDHVLYNRVPGYQPLHLQQLVTSGQAFEYWHHAASYLPMSAYRFALVRMRDIKNGKRHWMRVRDKKLEAQVLDRIRVDGPLMARDFEAPKRKGVGWWDWKPAKKALEQLFMQGDLAVAAREGFQKVYDLPERVIPSSTNTQLPSAPEHAEFLLEQVLANFGTVTLRSATYLQRSAKLRTACRDLLRDQLAQGRLVEVLAEGPQPIYCRPELLTKRLPTTANRLQILSPFDHSVIQRDRCQNLFNFDYQIECYVPAPKRQYGYFCLPLLYQDTFVGRMDCKAHRKQGRLEIINLALDTNALAKLKIIAAKPNAQQQTFTAAFVQACQAYAEFNQCTEVTLGRATPAGLGKAISSRIKALG